CQEVRRLRNNIGAPSPPASWNQSRTEPVSTSVPASNAVRRRRQSAAGRRQHLARVEDPVRIEQGLDAAEQRQQVAVLALEVLLLAEPDSMLAGAGAPA